jgi:AcrR family transcriptional regulator
VGHMKEAAPARGRTAGTPNVKRVYRMTARKEAVNRAREAMLRAAFGLWLERPYDEVTLDDVAELAGVSRQTVLRHFRSKEGLVVAVVDWVGPQEDVARRAEPGDVAVGLQRLVDRYETIGDANVRLLELEGRMEALDYGLAQGRASHRAWIEHLFGPLLPRRGTQRRERAVMALYAATDVTVWKLLRRDFGQTRKETEATITLLVDGVLAKLGTSSKEKT